MIPKPHSQFSAPLRAGSTVCPFRRESHRQTRPQSSSPPLPPTLPCYERIPWNRCPAQVARALAPQNPSPWDTFGTTSGSPDSRSRRLTAPKESSRPATPTDCYALKRSLHRDRAHPTVAKSPQPARALPGYSVPSRRRLNSFRLSRFPVADFSPALFSRDAHSRVGCAHLRDGRFSQVAEGLRHEASNGLLIFRFMHGTRRRRLFIDAACVAG